MSLTILCDTQKNIHEAYQTNNITEIGKETLFVFDRAVHAMLSYFKDRLKGITFDSSHFNFNETFLLSKKNMKQMFNILELLNQSNLPNSNFDLGKMKVDVQKWYYDMGGEGMYFEYHDNYLITPKEAADSLGVSTVTLNKYMKQGLEAVDTTSHHKIPKHVIELWNDPVYAIRMQKLSQKKKLKDQTPEDRLKEIRDEITELQKDYKAKTVSEAKTKYGVDNIDAMDDPSSFREWSDLETEYNEMLEKLVGGSDSV